MRWQSIRDRLDERWLGTCECGKMRAFLPDSPDLTPEDPLKAFLVGPEVNELPKERPPWIRVVLLSSEWPFNLSWTPLPEPCPSCSTRTITGGRRGVYPTRGANHFPMKICLACGFASVSDAAMVGPERFLTGDQWTPPCPAVKRLRRIALTVPMAVDIDV